MWAMTSKQITFCGKHKDVPLRAPLRKVVGTRLRSGWGGDSFQKEVLLGPTSVLEWNSLFIPGSLGQQRSKAVTQGLDQWDPDQCRTPLMDKMFQSSRVGLAETFSGRQHGLMGPLAHSCSAFSFPRCYSGSAPWKPQPTAYPDNKGTYS